MRPAFNDTRGSRLDRVTVFLANLLRETGATVESVSAEGYRVQVHANGVVLPPAGAIA